MKWINLKTTVFIILAIIGILVHHPSLNLSLYGDEWIDIFQYFTHMDLGQFSPLPGLLKYINPYGFAILLIGNLYKLFGTTNELYYILSLMFKIAVSYGLYLVCLEIGQLMAIKNSIWVKLLSFLVALLFLVGYTGLQTTDWIHYMNIYLATSLALFGLLFQFKSYKTFNTKQMFVSNGLVVASLVIGSLRLFPLIVVVPLIDIWVYLSKRKDNNSTKLLYKIGVFFGLIGILWGIGLFGSPFSFYSYGDWTLSKFINSVFNYPVIASKAFLFGVGVLLLPNKMFPDVTVNISLGLILLTFFLYQLYRFLKSPNGNSWILTLGVVFWMFYITIWYFGPISFASSEHRYLFVPFVMLLLWLYSIFIKTRDIKKVPAASLLKIGIFLLILVHLYSTRLFYSNLLAKGRSAAFAKEVERAIIEDLNHPMKDAPYVYFDVDDAEVQQSLLFGLGFKTLVLTKNWDKGYLFNQYDDLKKFRSDIFKKISEGTSKDDMSKLIYAYRVRDKKVTNISEEIRKSVLEGE